MKPTAEDPPATSPHEAIPSPNNSSPTKLVGLLKEPGSSALLSKGTSFTTVETKNTKVTLDRGLQTGSYDGTDNTGARKETDTKVVAWDGESAYSESVDTRVFESTTIMAMVKMLDHGCAWIEGGCSNNAHRPPSLLQNSLHFTGEQGGEERKDTLSGFPGVKVAGLVIPEEQYEDDESDIRVANKVESDLDDEADETQGTFEDEQDTGFPPEQVLDEVTVDSSKHEEFGETASQERSEIDKKLHDQDISEVPDVAGSVSQENEPSPNQENAQIKNFSFEGEDLALAAPEYALLDLEGSADLIRSGAIPIEVIVSKKRRKNTTSVGLKDMKNTFNTGNESSPNEKNEMKSKKKLPSPKPESKDPPEIRTNPKPRPQKVRAVTVRVAMDPPERSVNIVPMTKRVSSTPSTPRKSVPAKAMHEEYDTLELLESFSKTQRREALEFAKKLRSRAEQLKKEKQKRNKKIKLQVF